MTVSMYGHTNSNQLMMDLLFQMAFNPALEENTFSKEKRIVLKETNQHYASPGYRANREINQQLFTPGSRTLVEGLGDPSTVQSHTLEDIRTKHQNMVRESHIVLRAFGGNLDNYQMYQILDELTRSTKTGALPINNNPKNTFNFNKTKSVINPMGRDECQLNFVLPVDAQENLQQKD